MTNNEKSPPKTFPNLRITPEIRLEFFPFRKKVESLGDTTTPAFTHGITPVFPKSLSVCLSFEY